MILLKKSDRDEEFYYAPTKSKKKGAKGAVKKEESGKGKSIKHDVATFQLFDKLKLDAPVNTDEIPSLIEKLEKLLEEYNEKVRQWELTREEQKRKIMSGEVDPFAKKEEKKEDKKEDTEEKEKKEDEEEEEKE